MKPLHLRSLPVFVILALLSSLAFSCKKSKNSGLDFTYSGILHRGYLITFHSTVSSGSSCLWMFGDGSQSTDPNPNHTYLAGGSYIVSLYPGGDSAKAVRKTLIIGDDFTFTYSGIPSAGIALTFTSTAPAGSKLSWSFGDGSASTDFAPTHTFAANGTYKVSFVVNNDSSHVVAKDIIIFANAGYSYVLDGPKLFHHTYTDAQPWIPYHTTHTLADTTVTLTYIDPATVVFANDTLRYYVPYYYNDSLLTFLHQDNIYVPDYTTLNYNHYTGKIYYRRNQHISAGAGDTSDDYFTP